MKEIEQSLEGWGPGFDDYFLYELWDKYQILPHAGGWLDQPVHIHTLFNNCALWDEYLELKEKLPPAITTAKFEDS